jgi:hypothetical protein
MASRCVASKYLLKIGPGKWLRREQSARRRKWGAHPLEGEEPQCHAQEHRDRGAGASPVRNLPETTPAEEGRGMPDADCRPMILAPNGMRAHLRG